MDEEISPSTQSNSSNTVSARLRVVALDSNATCLKIVARMLQLCQYEVVAVKHASEALSILRSRKGEFNMVLTEIHMPHIDGFAFLESILREFNLPVIVISSDDKEPVMIRCLESGASFFLVKPLSMNDVNNIWQHVVQRRSAEMEEDEQRRVSGPSTSEEESEEDSEYAVSVNISNPRRGFRRRKRRGNDEDEEEDVDGPATYKKARLIWCVGLHNRFLEAIDQLGFQNAVPKTILALMNVPGLTRKNVASHLQKYRIHLRNLPQQSKSSVPSLGSSLAEGDHRSSFPYPFPMLNAHEGFPRMQAQPHAPTENQPRLGSCSMPQLGYGISLPTNSQRNMMQSLLGTVPSFNQQNETNYAANNMEPQNIRMESSLCNVILGGLARGTNTVEMIQQQPQFRPGNFTSIPLNHNFSTSNLPENNNIQSVGNMELSNNLNQVPNFNYTNNNYAGLQMTSTGLLVGSSQMPSGHGPSNVTNCGDNMMNEISRGNMALSAAGNSPQFIGLNSLHSDYATQGLDSSNGFQSINEPPTMFNDVIQQPQGAPTPPSEDQQQNGTGVGEEIDDVFDLLNDISTFGDASFLQPFDDGDFGDILDQVDHSCNQKQGFEAVVDHEFNIDVFQFDDNPLL